MCNPDFSLLVALGVPRSAFLACFQPAGASRRPTGGDAKIQKKTSIKTNGCSPWNSPCFQYTPIYRHPWSFLEFFEKVVSKALSLEVLVVVFVVVFVVVVVLVELPNLHTIYIHLKHKTNTKQTKHTKHTTTNKNFPSG
jgi:hypothetical protein